MKPIEAEEVEPKSKEEPLLDTKDQAETPSLSELAQFLRHTRAVLPLAVIGIGLMTLVAFLYFAGAFLMPVVIAVMLSFLLKPLVRGLARVGLSETLGAIVVMVFVLGAISMAISQLAQPASDWAAKAPESLRQMENKIRKLLQPAAQLTKAARTVENLLRDPDGGAGKKTPASATDQTGEDTAKIPVKEPTKIEVKSSRFSDVVFSYTTSFLAGAIETIVLLYFLLAAGDLFMHKLLKVLPTLSDKKKAVEIGHEVQHNISTFLFTITLINACLGLVVGLAMMLVGMPNPFLWGVVAGLLNFIPYFGPMVGVAVLLLAGFVTFDPVGRALLPPVIYFTLHALESNFVTPMILGRRLTMNPVVIFTSLMFWTWLWGIPGALLSVPMLMMLKVFCDHFKPLGPLGEFISG